VWNTYQFVGSTFEKVKKHAVVGSPRPSIYSFGFRVKFGGISLEIGRSLASLSAPINSGRNCLMVALRLFV